MVLLRFAPSPTGALHLGGLRTALYNYLYARKLGGKWILRIEDTDAGRAVPGAVEGIRNALEWAGLDYDHADRLAATREKLARSGSNSTYDKSCLNLTEEEVARKVRAGEKSVVRFNEWLPSLPLHLDLYAALKLKPPQFAHLPILLNADGTKMSKRKGDVQVLDYKRRGWEPNAILNWLALAGWGQSDRETFLDPSDSSSSSVKRAPDSTTLMTLQELVQEFDLSSVTHRRTVLDPQKLEYLNKHHLMREMAEPGGLTSLAERAHPNVKAAFPPSPHTSVEYITQVITTLQGRIVNILDIPSLAPYFFIEPDYSSEEACSLLATLPRDTYITALTDLKAHLTQANWDNLNIIDHFHAETARLGLKQKVYMTILRHALTGMKTGPSVADILRVLGTERSLDRLSSAIQNAENSVW
ncbi:hypothetical protein NLI96_g6232 [Meripilus lineatus]|uniref:Glutamyl-tRNA synthetase n=1 Tax=Meripilus lineatus TaxID=2056292 RepID=A0AAD5YD68_9APHY|nr:hypothetical protein NLI96_g6232 [Physisporinus lineatus]